MVRGDPFTRSPRNLFVATDAADVSALLLGIHVDVLRVDDLIIIT